MALTYKLTYFDARGSAEPIRFLFAYAGVPFEDVRIDEREWPTLKAKYPWETLPVLEFDGKVLSLSGAILRYLATEFSLEGEDRWESAKCGEMIGAMEELRKAVSKFCDAENEIKKGEVKADLLKVTFPKFLNKWSEILKANKGFLVGNKLSVADFYVASFLDVFDDVFGRKILRYYPAMEAHQERVFNTTGIKEWIEKRPRTLW